jgi:hypothetical protein
MPLLALLPLASNFGLLFAVSNHKSNASKGIFSCCQQGEVSRRKLKERLVAAVIQAACRPFFGCYRLR